MAKKCRTAAEKRHLDRLAQLPCVLGKALGDYHGPVQIHHLREGQGISQRGSDFLAVPLCPDCHQGVHGVHGDRSLMRIAKVEELDLLAMTIEMLEEQYGN